MEIKSLLGQDYLFDKLTYTDLDDTLEKDTMREAYYFVFGTTLISLVIALVWILRVFHGV